MYENNNKTIKDDNIHKRKALKSGRKDKRTITLVKCQNLISRTLNSKTR